MSCFINGSLLTQVHSLCGYRTFLKANESPGFRTCCDGLWLCALGAGGPLHEVFCTGNAFICTGSACFADAIVITGAESVVVLRELPVRELWQLYWNRTGTVLFFTFSICHLISGTHLMYCSMYCSLCHSLCSHKIYHLTYHLIYHSLFCLHSFY